MWWVKCLGVRVSKGGLDSCCLVDVRKYKVNEFIVNWN